MTAALRPVSDADAGRMALSLVQAMRARLSQDELNTLVWQHLDELLDGRREFATAADGAAFLRSVIAVWTHTAGIAACFVDRPDWLTQDIAENGPDAALQRLGLAMAAKVEG